MMSLPCRRLRAFKALPGALLTIKLIFLLSLIPPGNAVENDLKEMVTVKNLRFVSLDSPQQYSSMHCIGETFSTQKSWLYRSCYFQNLCYHMGHREHFVVQSPEERSLHELLRRRGAQDVFGSTFMDDSTAVASGSITSPVYEESRKWFPRVYSEWPSATGYYEVDALWVPFQSSGAENHDSVLWNDLLPVYTLLHIFDLFERDMILSTLESLPEDSILQRMAPLMGVDRIFAPSELQNANKLQRSDIICSRHGVIGLGILSSNTHNMARSIVLEDFRDFVLDNLNLRKAENPIKNRESSVVIIGSHQSLEETRLQIESIASLSVQIVNSTLSWQEQIRLVNSASAVVSVCGQASLAAFLPTGATLVLICKDDEEERNDILVRQERELLLRAGYIHTHRVPATGNTKRSEAILRELADKS